MQKAKSYIRKLRGKNHNNTANRRVSDGARTPTAHLASDDNVRPPNNDMCTRVHHMCVQNAAILAGTDWGRAWQAIELTNVLEVLDERWNEYLLAAIVKNCRSRYTVIMGH